MTRSVVSIECTPEYTLYPRSKRRKKSSEVGPITTAAEEKINDIEADSGSRKIIKPIDNPPILSSIAECHHCGKKYTKKSRLVAHLREHRHACAECPRTFSLARHLSAHVDKSHRQRLYQCGVCDYNSKNKGTLKNHFIRLHTSNYEYSCEKCGKQFKIKKSLNHHVKQNHSDAPPIVCEVCGHFSKNLHALKAHMKYRHYKPEFVCKICSRGMTTRENLEQHVAWHETREKILCPTCGKRFRGRDLELHMRVHTGVKPFSCPVCDKTFRRQTAQEQHLLIHTGKRPYVCNICGQAFAQKPGLICHRKRHPGPLPPLPVVSIKSIVNEFTREYATKKFDVESQ